MNTEEEPTKEAKVSVYPCGHTYPYNPSKKYKGSHCGRSWTFERVGVALEYTEETGDKR